MNFLLNKLYILKTETVHFLEVIFVMPNSVSLFINILVNVQKNTISTTSSIFYLYSLSNVKNNNKEKKMKIFKTTV